jgi:hypothetical protein
LRDCATVIAANSRASKAYYRAGLALLALERVEEALDVCTRAGEGVADDAGFRALRARAEKKRGELRRKEEERKERARHVKEEKRKMDVAFAVRSLSRYHCDLNSSCVGWASTGTKIDQRAKPGGQHKSVQAEI